MSRIWRVFAACLGLALVGYFVWFAAQSLNITALRQALTSPRQIAGIIIAALLYALIIPVTAWAWRRLLDAQGEHWTVPRLARFMGLAQLAKYVPGNVAQHATRAVLSLRAGMGTRAFVASVGQETLLAVAASLLIGLPMLALSEPGLNQLSTTFSRAVLVLAVGLAVAVSVLASVTLPPERLLGHPNRWLRALGRVGGLPGPAASLAALAAYAFNYLMIGVGLWILAGAMDMPASLDLSLLTATFALSWVLGFLAPGAPAGLGAREGIMLLLLRGSAPADALLVFVLLARVVTMLGDGLCFGTASLWRSNDTGKQEDLL